MHKVKVLFLSLLAVLAIGSLTAATASAAVQGPWWLKQEGGKQVKIEPATHLQVKSINEGAFKLKSTIIGIAVTIECRKVLDKGFLWNDLHQGADESTVKFTECFMVTPCAAFPVIVSEVSVFSELMWKYRGIAKELTEAGGQQKIYNVFGPEIAPEEFEKGKGSFRAPFTELKIPTEFEGKKCPEGGPFTVYAVGSIVKNWLDQKGLAHEVIWGTAAEVTPQNEDAKVVRMKWVLPNVKKLHVEEHEQIAELRLGVNPAELEGTIKLEGETEMAEFGAWNEVR
jgi:hypothetical protein